VQTARQYTIFLTLLFVISHAAPVVGQSACDAAVEDSLNHMLDGVAVLRVFSPTDDEVEER
jgi:hypothetical protein